MHGAPGARAGISRAHAPTPGNYDYSVQCVLGVPSSYGDTAAVARRRSSGGGVPMGTAVGLYDEHSPVNPDLCPPPEAGIPGIPLSEEASHFSATRCVLFCRVLAVSLRLRSLSLRPHLSADSASTERRRRRPRAKGPRWRVVSRQFPCLVS